MRLCSLFLMLLLTGCAFAPQQVKLAPQISIEESAIGAGIAIALIVRDERANDSVIGRRGSTFIADSSAEITSSDDLAALMKAAMERGLRKRGFSVIYSESAACKIDVAIRALDYEPIVAFSNSGIRITGAIKIDAIRGSRTYDRVIRSINFKKTSWAPNAATNELWINEALNDLLAQFFADTALSQLLTQD